MTDHNPETLSGRYHTEATLADKLQLHPSTITRMRRKGLIPYYQIGRQIRFSPEDVEKCLEEMRKVSPTGE